MWNWQNILNTINRDFLGISFGQYGLAFLVILISLVFKNSLAWLISGSLKKITARTKTSLDDKLLEATKKPLGYLVMAVGIRVALGNLIEHDGLFNCANSLIVAAVIWVLLRAADVISEFFQSLAAKTETKFDDQLVPLGRKALKIFIVLCGAIAVATAFDQMDKFGTLLAGLGLGGLAFALAAKDTVANIFGAIMIYVDRPFQIGDLILADGQKGVVEDIGLRSTKIRTASKTLISIPNGNLANMTIDNFSKMPKRRVYITVGVTYESTPDQMEKAVEAIKNILRTNADVHQEFFLVNFTDFADSSLDIMVYYYTKTTVWAEHMEVRQEINLAIMRTLEDLGMEIAFPSRTVYLKQENATPQELEQTRSANQPADK